MIQHPLRLSFTGGEISPWATSRIDLDVFSRAATRIQNFMITPFGGLTRRPGFRFVTDALTTSGTARLIPFQYSTGQAYILEFAPGKIRVFYNGSVLKSVSGYDYVITTPWSDVSSLHIKQINDVMYICSGSHPVKRLERRVHQSWALVDISWKNIPWRHNSRQSKALIYANLKTTYEGRPQYKLYGIGDNWIGSYGGDDYIRLNTVQEDISKRFDGEGLTSYLINNRPVAQLNENGKKYEPGNVVYKELNDTYYFYHCVASFVGNSSNNSDPAYHTNYFAAGAPVDSAIWVDGKWEFRTNDLWQGEWILKKSYDGGSTWITERRFQSTQDANYTASGDESEEPCLMRIFLASSYKYKPLKYAHFRVLSHKVEHVFKIIGVREAGVSYNAVKMTSVDIPNLGSTQDWSLSAFGSVNGYPSTMVWHQNRLVFGGTPAQPQTLWLSKTDDYHNFKLGANDSDAMELTISADSQNRIKWLHSQQKIFFGTSEGEWTLDSSDGRALSGNNARFVCHSHQGGEDFMCIPMESSLLFVQRGGEKIRELSYNINNDGYATSDLTLFADHITMGGIRDLSLFHDRSQVLWVIKNNGEAATMTWIPLQNILAWNRQVLSYGAKILSVAALYNNTESQELWAIVERKTGDTVCRNIEILGKRANLPSSHDKVTKDNFPIYLDSWSNISRDSQNRLTLPKRLREKSLIFYPNGCPHFSFHALVPANGIINLSDYTSRTDSSWVAGIPYESLVTTLSFDFPETMGQIKNHISTQINLLHSYPEVEYKTDLESEWFRSIAPRSFQYKEDVSNLYYSGYLPLQQAVIHERMPQLSLKTCSHHPLNILSIIPQISFGEDQQ